MRISKKHSLRTRLYGFFLLSHPVPVLFHLAAVALFVLLAAWPRLLWPIMLLTAGAHTAMQLAIAVLNDYCDRARDEVGKPEKPIPRGLVTPREALITGCALIALMILLLLPLPLLAWLISLLYLILGLSYNLGLKSTPLSGVVFALAMPLIPLYAFAGMGRGVPFLLWLAPVGFLLGVALNLANSLPDLEEDAASGARTLAVVLGRRISLLTTNTLLTLAALLILSLHLTGSLRASPSVLTITLGLTVLLLILLFTRARKVQEADKGYFYLVTLTCIVLAGGWFIGVLI